MKSELFLLLLFLVHCIIIKHSLIHGVTAFDITSFQSLQLCPGKYCFNFLWKNVFVHCCTHWWCCVRRRLTGFLVLTCFTCFCGMDKDLAAWSCVKKHTHVHRFFVLHVLLTMLGLMSGTHCPCTVPLSISPSINVVSSLVSIIIW